MFSRRLHMVALTLGLVLCASAGAAQPRPRAPADPAGRRVVAGAVGAADYTAAWRRYLIAQRRTNIRRLQQYGVRGVFSRNTVQAGMANVFIDDRGHLCAAANLIALSGHRDLVDATARDNNLIRLMDVRSGALLDWMLTSGLTQEEIALIQEPGYMGIIPSDDPSLQPEPQEDEFEKRRLQAHYRIVAQRLRATERSSVAAAIARLGERVHTPPPAS